MNKNLKLGYVIGIYNNFIKVLVPFNVFHCKYKKLQLKVKLYLVKDTRKEAYINNIVLIKFYNIKKKLKFKLVKIFNNIKNND